MKLLKRIFSKKSADLKALERTIQILSGFHAMLPDNEQFQKQYRQIFILIHILSQKENDDV